MLSTLWAVLSDRPTQYALATVLAVDLYTCYRAHEGAVRHRVLGGRRSGASSTERFVAANAQTLEGGYVWLLPLASAAVLVILFFVLRSVGALLTLFSAVAGFAAGIFFLLPLGGFIARRARAAGIPLPCHDEDDLAVLLAALPALAIVLVWLMWGHFLANNALGIFTCVLFGAVIRADSFRTITILFSGLFVYDVFFVFFSERIFGRNVMVEVATSAANNPANILAAWLHLPFSPVKNLALPAKLIFPDGQGTSSILGLGDIVLPIVLLVFLLEIDLRLEYPIRKAFFIRGMVAHLLGLVASFYCNIAFQAAQPALFYIVPLMLSVTALTAQSRRILPALWTGSLHSLGSSEASFGANEDIEGQVLINKGAPREFPLEN